MVRRRHTVQAALAVAVLTILQLVRQSSAQSWSTIWAEDGRYYATDALSLPAGSTLLRGYAGYVQVVQRLLALPVRVLPASTWAVWFALASAAVTAGCAVFVYCSSEGLISSTTSRWLLAVMTAVAPVMWYETTANLANLGWPLLFASFWAIISRRAGSGDLATRAVVVAATALSTTLAALLFPFACLVALHRRSVRREWVVLGALTGGLVVQVVADRFTAPGVVGPSSVGDLPAELGMRVFGSVAFGERWLSRLWMHWSLGAVVLAIAVISVPVIIGARRAMRPQVRLAVLAGAAAVVMFVVPVWIRGTAGMRLSADFTNDGSRYAVVPVLLVITAVLAIADHHRLVAAGLAAHGTVVILTSFALVGPRSIGPTWPESLDAARAACAVRGTAVAVVPVSPGGEWTIAVPCGRIDVLDDDATAALASTRFADVRWVEQTGSTNADALALARDGAREGIVLVADHQTAGRGRQGRTWTAPAGASLLTTILLRPPAAVAGLVTMAVALAASDAVADVAGFVPRLKWPNDLVWPGDGSAPDRKLAGILAEAEWPARSPAAAGHSEPPPDEKVVVAVGMGLNVTWPAELPDELADIAIACNHVCGRDVDRAAVLVSLLRHLEEGYAALLADRTGATLLDRWRNRSATLGRRVRVDLGSDDLVGTAVDVTSAGHLVVETLEGDRRVVAVGDVVHLRND